MWWPKLEDKIKIAIKEPLTAGSEVLRSDRDLLQEVLVLSRAISQRTVKVGDDLALEDMVDGLTPLAAFYAAEPFRAETQRVFKQLKLILNPLRYYLGNSTGTTQKKLATLVDLIEGRGFGQNPGPA